MLDASPVERPALPAAEADPEPVPEVRTDAPAPARRWLILVEAAVSIGSALAMVLLAQWVEVSPLDRIGQVSGLAALQLRFALIALALLVAVTLAAAARRRSVSGLVVRLAAAGVAGLSSGLVAGGILIALRGTEWGLNGPVGDMGTLLEWARTLLAGGSMPASYPPGFVHALAWYAQLTGDTPEHSLKVLQIGLTALFGPAVYLAWRLLLSPVWALAIGVVAALPLIDPYKPYTNVMLAVLVPVLLLLLRRIRRAGTTPWRVLVLSGCGFGLGIGVIFLVYSGWFVWSAPGVLVAAALVFPWRTGLWRGLTLVGVTAVVFLLVAHQHLLGLFDLNSRVQDSYFFFDTWAEPAYIAMWRGDLPGADVGPWPPPGELGGVGLFTILLLAGLAAAIILGRRRTVVLGLLCVFAGTWLLRFHYSSHMYADNAVQLYPRSTLELLYCLLLLGGFAVQYAIRAAPAGWPRSAATAGSVRIGALAALVLLIASAGSATADRYMPRTDDSAGMLAFTAQVSRQPGGGCSAYLSAMGRGCAGPNDPGFAELVQDLARGAPRPGQLPHRAP